MDTTEIRLQAVLKLSGFCNARCFYCYEWDRLADRTRMDLALLERIAEDYAGFAGLLEQRTGLPVRISFILHGGEPLVLPLDYLQGVADVITTRGPATQDISVQTNAYRLTDEHLAFLVERGIMASISNDVIPGVRVTAAGKPMEERAHENALRLKEAGRLMGGITVLSKVTASHLPAVHAYWTALGVPYRLLPLFRNGGPDVDRYGLTEEESARALADFALALLETGQPVTAIPLDEIVSSAALSVSRSRTHRPPSLPFGRRVFVFNTDGLVYDQTATSYEPEAVLGDMKSQRLLEILMGPRVQALLASDAALAQSLCASCPFETSCSGWPLQVDARRTERCGVAYQTTRLLAEGLAAAMGDAGWWEAA